jgi:hypothetical protein
MEPSKHIEGARRNLPSSTDYRVLTYEHVLKSQLVASLTGCVSVIRQSQVHPHETVSACDMSCLCVLVETRQP